MTQPDTIEFNRLKKKLTLIPAAAFDTEPEYREHLKHWVLRVKAPHGPAYIDEFNFQEQAAADEAAEYIKSKLNK